MKIFLLLTTAFTAALISIPSFAQQPSPASSPAATANPPIVATSPVAAPSGSPSEAEMMKQMMELSKLNENHKLLASLDGTWTYTTKLWMNPDTNAKPVESKGTAVRKSVMGGRYVVMDVTGKMQMPGANGKMKDVTFKGMDIEGYDNVKKKFVSLWIDNMGTGIEFSEGTYDPATNSLTYNSEIEPMPGMKQQIRQVIKLTDKNHMILEWYQNQNGQEKKTMEIDYTRAKAR